MARASKAKRPERTFDVRSSLGPTLDREVLPSSSNPNDGGGVASVAEYIFGAHSQGPPGKELAL